MVNREIDSRNKIWFWIRNKSPRERKMKTYPWLRSPKSGQPWRWYGCKRKRQSRCRSCSESSSDPNTPRKRELVNVLKFVMMGGGGRI